MIKEVIEAMFIAGIALSSVLLVSCWIPDGKVFRVDVMEMDRFPSQWFAWGWCKSYPSGRISHQYWHLRLPSYQMKETDFGRSMCWHQLVVHWFEGIGTRVDWIAE